MQSTNLADETQKCREDLHALGTRIVSFTKLMDALFMEFFGTQSNGFAAPNDEDGFFSVARRAREAIALPPDESAAREELNKRAWPYLLPIEIQWSAFSRVAVSTFGAPMKEELFFYELCLKTQFVVLAGQALCDCIVSAHAKAKENDQADIAHRLGYIDFIGTSQLESITEAAAPFRDWAAKCEVNVPSGMDFQADFLKVSEQVKQANRKLEENQDQLTMNDLAKLLGITREAIDKRLRRLVRDGWISTTDLIEPKRKKYFDPATAEIIRRNPKGKNPDQ